MARFAPFLFVFLWSTGFLGAKFGLPHAAPLAFLSVRYALVLALMTTLALAFRAPWPRDGRQWLHIGVAGLLVHGVYLGGVFFSISALPGFWREFASINPIFYLINGFRYGILGISDVSISTCVAVLFGLAAALIAVNWYFIRTGLGLRQ